RKTEAKSDSSRNADLHEHVVSSDFSEIGRARVLATCPRSYIFYQKDMTFANVFRNVNRRSCEYERTLIARQRAACTGFRSLADHIVDQPARVN
ncbi:MAG TPA: hypothetical protein VIX11_12685, partial [Candidatus Acidoferrum sp.]